MLGALVGVHVWAAVHESRIGFTGLVDGLIFERDPRFRVSVGGKYASLVEAGEFWRLWTSVFVHVDLVHLALNAISIYGLGRLLEPWIGPTRLWTWFLVGGVGGSLASWLAGVTQSDGASGGAFALLGAAVVLGFERRHVLEPEDRRLMGPWLWGFVALNLLGSVVIPTVDLVGHLGGLAMGLLISGAVGTHRALPVRVGEWIWLLGSLVIFVMGWGFGWRPP